ncbi:MAG: DUF3592 domain-containing protein [Oscillospiraceae bacterium]|nr:DUF3592 domain-containing protein [Oscillospiraceae bacterium]
MKINVKKLVIILLFSVAIISGIVLLFLGIRDSVITAIKTKDWFDTTGYFRDYSVYSINSDGETLYRLKYVYYSGGAEYFIETEYGSEVIPEIDSIRTVLYEPENPENAVLKGGTASAVYLTIGFMFTFIPLFMIIIWLYINDKIKLPENTLDFTVGFIIFAVGELCIYVMSGSIFLWKAFASMGFLAIIPSLMVAAGIFQMVKTTLYKKS